MNYALIRASPASASSLAPPRRAPPPSIHHPRPARAIPSLGLTRFTSLFVTVQSDGTDKCLSSSALRIARASRACAFKKCPASAPATRNASARLAVRVAATHAPQQSPLEPPKRLFNASQDARIRRSMWARPSAARAVAFRRDGDSS